ncbi:MAG: NADH:flavin oxidoreductase/NADH oxidase family protein [Deltaproteobacteria bacterium]|nr:NADH:flavin oxidoreductase/NADH oxidase family protein [Deltaproteobacteria bacterium]
MTLLAAPLPLRCGRQTRNRLLKSAMTEALADLDGNPNDHHQRLYRTWAQGGVGLQITGNVMIDRRYLERSGNVIFDGRTELGAIRQWSAAAQEGGTLALVQLNHPGRQTTRFVTSRPIAPSAGPAVSTLKSFARPRAMTEREVRETIERYADAAELAELGGFDGVQIHAAHGYLISQFLSPLTNQRDDEWGGSAERRRRFLIEVLRTVRARTRANFIVGVKLNSADFQRGGFDEAESMAVVDDLAKEAIDFLEVSGGNYEATEFFGLATRDRTRAREAYFFEYARAVKARVPGLPIVLTGGLRTRSVLEEALQEGAADLLGLARTLCLEPDLPRRFLDGSAAAALPLLVRWPRAKSLAALGEGAWYGAQLKRLGAGKAPAPGIGVWAASLAQLSADAWRGIGRRVLGVANPVPLNRTALGTGLKAP